MFADNVLGWEIVLKISYLPSKLRFSVKYSFFGQSLSHGHYQPTYQPPEGVYLLISCVFRILCRWFLPRLNTRLIKSINMGSHAISRSNWQHLYQFDLSFDFVTGCYLRFWYLSADFFYSTINVAALIKSDSFSPSDGSILLCRTSSFSSTFLWVCFPVLDAF